MSRIVKISESIWVNVNKITMISVNEYKGEFKTDIYTCVGHPLIEIYTKTREEAVKNITLITRDETEKRE